MVKNSEHAWRKEKQEIVNKKEREKNGKKKKVGDSPG